MDIDLTCRFQYGISSKDKPILVIEFGPEMTVSDIRELAGVLERTAVKWANCKGCGNGTMCGESYSGHRDAPTLQ
jgi:hypothetical protein